MLGVWIVSGIVAGVLALRLMPGSNKTALASAPRNRGVATRGSTAATANGKARKVQAKNISVPAGPFAAVSINPGIHPCQSAQALEDKRILLENPVVLPLPECDAGKCTCRLVHHEDRRSNAGDRRMGIGLQSELYGASGEQNRRGRRRGRRKTDV